MELTITQNTTKFYKDVVKGLQSSPKYLESKYFYDERGDELFQQIMNCDDYYLTGCEMEILKTQSSDIASTIFASEKNFDVIELGAGDCSKSVFLLRQIFRRNKGVTFFPVDISKHVIDLIKENLPKKVRGLNIHGLNGEYIEMLKKANQLSSKRKLVLFMGSNIGNMNYKQSIAEQIQRTPKSQQLVSHNQSKVTPLLSSSLTWQASMQICKILVVAFNTANPRS